jgi:hypothetical protein
MEMAVTNTAFYFLKNERERSVPSGRLPPSTLKTIAAGVAGVTIAAGQARTARAPGLERCERSELSESRSRTRAGGTGQRMAAADVMPRSARG